MLIVTLDVPALEKDPVLDPDRLQLARAHADERKRCLRWLVLLDREAAAIVTASAPQPHAGREQELLPRVRPDGVAEAGLVRRVHGGALPPAVGSRPYAVRREQAPAAKAAIATANESGRTNAFRAAQDGAGALRVIAGRPRVDCTRKSGYPKKYQQYLLQLFVSGPPARMPEGNLRNRSTGCGTTPC